MNLIAEDIHAALDADFEAVLGRAMTPVERAAKRGEREDIERRERWFQMWLDTLRQDVIEDEYGYEPGEFTVYPEHWRALFDEHLTPKQAFDRALSAFARDRE
jgi:hypothetical protein